MRITIASDHAGYETKEKIKLLLKEPKHSVEDLGPANTDSVDYPDYALKVAQGVSAGKYERGILVCGTGLGMCITANKVKDVRAVTCHNQFTAEMSRRHNDANILCLGAKVVASEEIESIIRIWLASPFEGGRHARRVDKIKQIEKDKPIL